MFFELVHADTCLSCYWSGHHLPHMQIAVWRNMSLDDIKSALHNELSEGAVSGALDWEIKESDLFYHLAKEAINRLEPNDPKQTEFFADFEEQDENSEPVYAFFVLVPHNWYGHRVSVY